MGWSHFFAPLVTVSLHAHPILVTFDAMGKIEALKKYNTWSKSQMLIVSDLFRMWDKLRSLDIRSNTTSKKRFMDGKLRSLCFTLTYSYAVVDTTALPPKKRRRLGLKTCGVKSCVRCAILLRTRCSPTGDGESQDSCSGGVHLDRETRKMVQDWTKSVSSSVSFLGFKQFRGKTVKTCRHGHTTCHTREMESCTRPNWRCSQEDRRDFSSTDWSAFMMSTHLDARPYATEILDFSADLYRLEAMRFNVTFRT